MSELIDPKDVSAAAALMRAVEGSDDVEFLKAVIRNQIKRCPELWQVGRPEFVTMPTAEHMTEDMIDASRPVHLLYETSRGGVSCEEMIAHLGMGWPWTLKYIPPFMLEGGHLTKAGRAILCHSLTVAAWADARNFKVKPSEQQIKDVQGERLADEKILKEIQRAIVEDVADVDNARIGQEVHQLTGFVGLMEYDLNGKVQQFPMRCNIHPAIELDGKKKMISVLVTRSDVPREARSLVKRTGTKIMFTLSPQNTVETGPYMVDTAGKPARSAVRCIKIDSLIAKRGTFVSEQQIIDEAVRGE